MHIIVFKPPNYITDRSSSIHHSNTWTGRLHCMEDKWETCPTCATMTSFTCMTSQWNNWGWRAIKLTSPGGNALAWVSIELLTVSSISLQSAGSLLSRQTNSQNVKCQHVRRCFIGYTVNDIPNHFWISEMIIWFYLLEIRNVLHSWFLLVAYRVDMSAMYWQTVLY